MSDPDHLLSHRDFVRTLARRLLCDREDVEDVVQSSLLRAMEHPPRQPGAWRSFLRSVTHNVVRQNARQKERIRAREMKAARSGETGVPTPAEIAEREQARAVIVEAVNGLDEIYRAVIVLRYFEELPTSEVALRLGLPVGTVWTRLHRGLALLRTSLDRRFGSRADWHRALASVAGSVLTSPRGRARRPLLWVAGAALISSFLGLSTLSLEGPQVGEELHLREGAAALVSVATRSESEVVRQASSGFQDDELVIHGMVKCERGEPVAHYPVRYRVRPFVKRKGRSFGPSEVYTNARGEYRIAGLVPGELWMNLLPESRLGIEEHEVEQEFRQSLEQHFVVRGPLRFRGRLKLKKPEVATIVLDYIEEHGAGVTSTIWGVRMAELDPQGRFDFTKLHPGLYKVRLVSEFHEHLEFEMQLRRSVLDFERAVARGHTLRGHVAVGEGKDPAGAALWVTSVEQGFTIGRLEADGQGAFEVPNLIPGDYIVFVRHQEGEAWRGTKTERRFRVTMPPADHAVTLELRPDRTLKVRVRLPEGQSRAAVELLARRADGKLTLEKEFQVYKQGESFMHVEGSPHGHFGHFGPSTASDVFVLPGLDAGTWQIRLRSLGFEEVVRALRRGEEQSILDVELEPAKGRFVKAKVGTQYWRVHVRTSGTRAWRELLFSDERVMITHTEFPGIRRAFLPPGTYDFRIRTDAFAEQHVQEVVVEDDRERELELTASNATGKGYRGALARQGGRPWAGTQLRVFRRRESGWERLRVKDTKVDEKDGYHVRGLLQGTYKLTFDDEGLEVVKEFVIED